ncbi:putative reverse transcriptase domain [Abeliophyllum distichum]|uniref:Reverse transcriptase domain n=1 Tax=Abeliophyllum distichum TaxID=126358 RepID=A0ABD1RUC0_9LAMI
MSPKALRSSPKNETLLIEINPLHSNVAIPRRLSWDQVTRNPLWTFENELPPVREAPNSRLKEITELADGSVQVQFASSSSTSRYSFQSSRSEPFQTFKQSEKQPSEKFKGVDFTPNIPKTHYSEEEDDSTHHGSESPTLSDMRSHRDQLNVISATIDRKREFKKDKDPQKISVSSNGLTSKPFKQKPTINTFQDKSKIWKTTSGNTFQSVHPPLEEIVIPKGDVKVIASPLKQISEKSGDDNPTIKDIKNIQQQNNYTNILLHSVATQLNQIDQPIQNEIVKQDKAKGKEKVFEKTSKTLFKPSENKVRFGSGTSGTSEVLLEIVKQLRDKESTSKINVIDSIEVLQDQFDELKINKLKNKSFERHPLPHYYPRPTFPDMLIEEPVPPQKSFSGLEVIVWNIDGKTEHQIMQVLSEMMMASSAYFARGNTDQEAATNIYNGFSGQLKDWWYNYLSSDDRDKILNAVKKEGDSQTDPSKQDAVSTLIFTIVKHFIGQPSSYMEKSSELLMNLTCPKLQDFRWYKDIFLQKVMLREDCKSAFWKERFIAGLPKLFAEKVRLAIKDEFPNLPYDILTFGEIIGFVNKEGLSLCNDLKLKAKLKSDRMDGRKELGSFCEQYGYERIRPPPSKSNKFLQKSKFQKKKKYFDKSFFPDYYRKPKMPSKFHRYNKNKRKREEKDKSSKNPPRDPSETTCWKCKKKGHYANKCPLRRKINNLQIDDEIKTQLLNLIKTDSSSSEDVIYNLQDDSDYSESSSSSKSSNSIKICNCKDNCTCETNSVNVLTSEKS